MIAIDPGTEQSAHVCFDGKTVWDKGIVPNAELLRLARSGMLRGEVAIEMIACYGMPVGKETFETCLFIGQLREALWRVATVRLVYRKDVKIHLCGSMKAKDGNIRQALIDKYGGDSIAIGGVKCATCNGKGWSGRGRPTCEPCAGTGWFRKPGPFHDITSHLWSALAIADYAINNPVIPQP